eukprot:350853-Chlamydomonas_euryale.AAC.1
MKAQAHGEGLEGVSSVSFQAQWTAPRPPSPTPPIGSLRSQLHPSSHSLREPASPPQRQCPPVQGLEQQPCKSLTIHTNKIFLHL